MPVTKLWFPRHGLPPFSLVVPGAVKPGESCGGGPGWILPSCGRGGWREGWEQQHGPGFVHVKCPCSLSVAEGRLAVAQCPCEAGESGLAVFIRKSALSAWPRWRHGGCQGAGAMHQPQGAWLGSPWPEWRWEGGGALDATSILFSPLLWAATSPPPLVKLSRTRALPDPLGHAARELPTWRHLDPQQNNNPMMSFSLCPRWQKIGAPSQECCPTPFWPSSHHKPGSRAPTAAPAGCRSPSSTQGWMISQSRSYSQQLRYWENISVWFMLTGFIITLCYHEIMRREKQTGLPNKGTAHQ